MKFGSLFTGGGGFDMGAQAAGLELAWGVEYIPEIAAWCNRQLGDHVRNINILEADPADFPPVDYLHASPPCPSFSVANSNAGETELDVALGEKTAEFIRVLRPKYFSLENVYGYRNSQSWAAIVAALHDCGYGFSVEHINSADFGVPQKRKRMIVRAVRDTFFSPSPLRPTHSEGGTGGLLPWVGWWEAVADIAHTFPESKLAPWQVKRLGKVRDLPALFDKQMDAPTDNPERRMKQYGLCDPAGAMVVHTSQYKAVLVNTNQSGDEGEAVTTAPGTGPSFTTKPADLGRLRAVLVDNQTDGTRREIITNDGDEPAPALKASGGGRLQRAVLLGNGSRSALNGTDTPADTITQNSNQLGVKAIKGSRVVALTPRALARFQTFPDWYELPEKKTLAVTIIGNAVPCLLAQRVVESLI